VPAVRSVAAETGAKLVDVYDALSNLKQDFPDNVHPNDDGAARIAQAVFLALSSTNAGDDAGNDAASSDSTADEAGSDSTGGGGESALDNDGAATDDAAGAGMVSPSGDAQGAGSSGAATGSDGSAVRSSQGKDESAPHAAGGGNGCSIARVDARRDDAAWSILVIAFAAVALRSAKRVSTRSTSPPSSARTPI
jgi:hypothetical protein